MNREKAEHILIEADALAELVLEGLDMTIGTAEGRALYDRAFTTYVRCEIGEVPMSELYEALKGSNEVVTSFEQR